MQILARCVCAAAMAVCVIPVCHATNSPWDGTWKLNQSKSKFTGDTFTITDEGSGKYRFSDGSSLRYDFACDGKAWPVLADRTETCMGSAGSGFDVTEKAGDKVLSKSHRMLSADGKTLTIKGESMHEDGTSSQFEDVYRRESGSSGLAGKWLNVKSQSNYAGTVQIEVNGDAIKMAYPTSKVKVEGKMDGSDTTVTGPTIPPGATMAMKAEGPHKFSYVNKYKGKVLDQGTDELSGDGKTLTEEDWVPGKMSEKSTAVYEKQ